MPPSDAGGNPETPAEHAPCAGVPARPAPDGPSKVYERFVVPAGNYNVAVRMRDTPRTDGFDHERRAAVTLAADQMFVVDFRAESGEFVFR
jgi:hypothetical protein